MLLKSRQQSFGRLVGCFGLAKGILAILACGLLNVTLVVASTSQSVVEQLLRQANYPLFSGSSYGDAASDLMQTVQRTGHHSVTWTRSQDDVWPQVIYVKLVSDVSAADVAATFFNYEDHFNNPNNARMGLQPVTVAPQSQDPLYRQVNYRIDLITLLGSSLGGLLHLVGREAAYSLGMTLGRIQSENYSFDWRLAHESGKMRTFDGYVWIFSTQEGTLIICKNDLQPRFAAVAARYEDRPVTFIGNLIDGLYQRTLTLKTSRIPADHDLFSQNRVNLNSAFSHAH